MIIVLTRRNTRRLRKGMVGLEEVTVGVHGMFSAQGSGVAIAHDMRRVHFFQQSPKSSRNAML